MTAVRKVRADRRRRPRERATADKIARDLRKLRIELMDDPQSANEFFAYLGVYREDGSLKESFD